MSSYAYGVGASDVGTGDADATGDAMAKAGAGPGPGQQQQQAYILDPPVTSTTSAASADPRGQTVSMVSQLTAAAAYVPGQPDAPENGAAAQATDSMVGGAGVKIEAPPGTANPGVEMTLEQQQYQMQQQILHRMFGQSQDQSQAMQRMSQQSQQRQQFDQQQQHPGLLVFRVLGLIRPLPCFKPCSTPPRRELCSSGARIDVFSTC